MRKEFWWFTILSITLGIGLGHFVHPSWYFTLAVTGPIILIGLLDLIQRRHSLRRNFPVLGLGRYVLEALRPKIYQYFIESDTNGTPINRMFRSIVYQRAKHELDTVPFGTQMDVYRVGYEWANHSINPLRFDAIDEPRVLVGGPDCKQPYSACIFNISAMSYGSLSGNAILSLNGGAKKGNFAHNTGEGGISSHHLKQGGDLIWQIGTGYFGCRDSNGQFNGDQFKENALRPEVKMIEIKLSQGAKPGHGGILPAKKNTPEIAAIRGVEPGTRVDSPPYHTAFTNSTELMHFIAQLRDLSGGKPVGFKLCLGNPVEFIDLCEAMLTTGIKPDYIAIDGGEGGTGAAPLEFSNSLGMPLRDGLAFAYDALSGFDLKKDIKVIASGKILTGFHVVRALGLGADLAYCARGMMLALGCIQALECNLNTCPTGVATQNTRFTKGLVVEDKEERVYRYHLETVHSVMELMAAMGLKESHQINRTHLFCRVATNQIKRYDQMFPYLEGGRLLDRKNWPENWQIYQHTLIESLKTYKEI